MESYEHICMVNRYLYGEMEACTAMIEFLRYKNMDTSELREKRFRVKQMIEANLEKMDFALDAEFIM